MEGCDRDGRKEGAKDKLASTNGGEGRQEEDERRGGRSGGRGWERYVKEEKQAREEEDKGRRKRKGGRARAGRGGK